MPSTFRHAAAAPALIALLACPASIAAQQTSAQASVQVTIRVQPTLAIHNVLPARAPMGSNGQVTSAAVVSVESNLPYRISVRLAAPPSDARLRVLVRNAAGAFELLTPGASVVAVASRTPGQRGHQIVCALEGGESMLLDDARCDLVYELSAEYHDTLLRAGARMPGLPRRLPPAVAQVADAGAAR